MTKQNKKTQSQPSARYNHICLPFESESHYASCVADTALYRKFLDQHFLLHPELFPKAFSSGYQFHSRYGQKKTGITLRRIKLKADDKVFAIRPSFVLPYAVERTDEVEKALYLRLYGVPFEALAYVFGRDASFYERTWLQLGRPSLVGTTIKDEKKLPAHIVADEKVTWLDGKEVYVATTVANGCFLGVGLATDTTTQELEKAYGEFEEEAREMKSDYAPETVCTDGFQATRLAWQQLFPRLSLILCFLHGVLKIRDRCRGELRRVVLDRVWNCYKAMTRREFSQRVRRVREWASEELAGAVKEMVDKLCKQSQRYVEAYKHPGCRRTTNEVDRLMNQQDRVLYSMRYLHGKGEAAKLALRAMALQWNFHPYGKRLRRDDPKRQSPFADLNGFQYHDNWLHNLLIAASLGGHKL